MRRRQFLAGGTALLTAPIAGCGHPSVVLDLDEATAADIADDVSTTPDPGSEEYEVVTSAAENGSATRTRRSGRIRRRHRVRIRRGSRGGVGLRPGATVRRRHTRRRSIPDGRRIPEFVGDRVPVGGQAGRYRRRYFRRPDPRAVPVHPLEALGRRTRGRRRGHRGLVLRGRRRVPVGRRPDPGPRGAGRRRFLRDLVAGVRQWGVYHLLRMVAGSHGNRLTSNPHRQKSWPGPKRTELLFFFVFGLVLVDQ